MNPVLRAGFTFPLSCRIRRRPEFDRVFRVGRSCHTFHFRVLVAPGLTEMSRLGLVVSRKVGKAHVRNRTKRLVREYFRLRRHTLTPCVDVVVVAKPSAVSLSWESVGRELDAVLEDWLRDSPSQP